MYFLECKECGSRDYSFAIHCVQYGEAKNGLPEIHDQQDNRFKYIRCDNCQNEGRSNFKEFKPEEK